MSNVPAKAIGDVRITLSSVDQLRRLAQPLLYKHAEELEPDLVAHWAPDWECYDKAEQQGQLITLAAWHAEELVGYAVGVVFRSHHYDLILCQHDLLYVVPHWRNRHGRVGRRLVEALRVEARILGAQRLIMHAKPNSVFERMLPKLGFRVEETVFVEDL